MKLWRFLRPKQELQDGQMLLNCGPSSPLYTTGCTIRVAETCYKDLATGEIENGLVFFHATSGSAIILASGSFAIASAYNAMGRFWASLLEEERKEFARCDGLRAVRMFEEFQTAILDHDEGEKGYSRRDSDEIQPL